MTEKGKVFTGARARITFQGVDIGYGTGCNSRENINFEKVRPLGHIRVVENVATSYDVSFTMDFVRLVGDSLKKNGLFPKTGVSDDDHLRNILTQGLLTIAIMDRVDTTKTLALLQEAQCSTRGMNIGGQGVVGENTEWVGTVINDESEV